MKILRWNNKKDIQNAKELISNGNVLAGSSDTVPGLLANLSKKSYDGLNRIKLRKEKPYIILVGSLDKVFQFVRKPLDNQIKNLMKTVWPGPVTLILPAKKDVQDYLKAPNGTIAIRIPNHPGLQQLLQDLPGVFSTSANKAGQPIPTGVDEIDQDIKDEIKCLIVDEKTKENVPSTIIDCTQLPIKIIREGTLIKR